MCDLMACSHDNAEQFDRRNYKEKEKNKVTEIQLASSQCWNY